MYNPSKKIKTSSARLAALSETSKKTLGRKQATGAMPKRQATAAALSALRVTSKPFIVVGFDNGNERAIKRGFDTVYDVGYDRAAALYCKRCGFMETDESLAACLLCGFDKFVSGNKFGLTCETCNLPFYKKSFTELERAARFVAVCSCFDAERAERALLLKDINFWQKKIAEQNSAVEFVRLADLPKVYDNERAAAYSRFRSVVFALALHKFERAERRRLMAERAELAKRLNIDFWAHYERRLLSDLLDRTAAALRIDTNFRKRGGFTLTLSERAAYIDRYKKLMTM